MLLQTSVAGVFLLCRFILKYYLFDNDKIDDEISEYLKTANEEDKVHFADYYSESGKPDF